MGDSHVRASIDHVVGSNYMGSHWLEKLTFYAFENPREEIMNQQQFMEILSKFSGWPPFYFVHSSRESKNRS